MTSYDAWQREVSETDLLSLPLLRHGASDEANVVCVSGALVSAGVWGALKLGARAIGSLINGIQQGETGAPKRRDE